MSHFTSRDTSSRLPRPVPLGDGLECKVYAYYACVLAFMASSFYVPRESNANIELACRTSKLIVTSNACICREGKRTSSRAIYPSKRVPIGTGSGDQRNSTWMKTSSIY